MGEKWSPERKAKINCSHPKGFSQKQYCKYGRNKRGYSPTPKKKNTYFKNYDLYSDANPKDTIRTPYATMKDLKSSIRKLEKIYKAGSKTKVDTKAMALVAAKRLFPKVNLMMTSKSTVPHDGLVDALLMAEYARRKFPR